MEVGTYQMRINNKTENVSTAFVPNQTDNFIIRNLLPYEGTPMAITKFKECCNELSDYAYWFMLSTLWVSYSGFSDLELWKELFSSNRPNKSISLMKPDELSALKKLPNKITVYRAHRQKETDWIAYTLDKNIADRFARERGTSEITAYKVKKIDILAYFTRRGEQEIIVINKSKVKKFEEGQNDQKTNITDQ